MLRMAARTHSKRANGSQRRTRHCPYESRPIELRAARYELGMSVTEVAELVGVAYDTFTRYERGGIPARAIQLKIASVYDADPNDFWPLADGALV